MRKTNAGGRKRTVTVTVGPICEKLMADIHTKMVATPGHGGVTPTVLASIGLMRIVSDWSRV